MLIESLVRTTLGVKDHKVVSVAGDTTNLVVRLDRKLERKLTCSCCGGRARVYDTLKEREWRHVPLWGIPVRVIYRPRRVNCPRCGKKVERVPWGLGKCRLTLPLIILLATWSRLLAIDVVAGLFEVSWSTVGSAVKGAVAYGLEHRDTSGVLHIGIDEISRKKGHGYHTQIYDLVNRRLLWSGEGRKAETLERFFAEWGADRSRGIKAICCDMWAPYVEVIKAQAPAAVLAFDKFHLIRHLHRAVDNVRKEEAVELKKKNPELLKGTKYIWLKNPWNLTPKQKQRLGYLEKLNLKVNRAYLLKESFRDLWSYRRKGMAKRYLHKWFWWATHSRLEPMRDFAWLLRRHSEDVLNWFKVPINNGTVEAMNNNAKAISHRARGYRSEKWFSLILLHCMGQLPMPEFTHRFA
ncbi:MAG TPA: ISL3 family transposase [bacterium]|nr:ISL3 family transposase [bacterium]